jgi:hypothetical protein
MKTQCTQAAIGHTAQALVGQTNYSYSPSVSMRRLSPADEELGAYLLARRVLGREFYANSQTMSSIF